MSRTLGSGVVPGGVTCELVILSASFEMLSTIRGRCRSNMINARRAIRVAIVWADNGGVVGNVVCMIVVVGIRIVGREGIMHGVGRGYVIRSELPKAGCALSEGVLREAAVSDVTKVLPGNRSVGESDERQAVLLYLVGWWPAGTT